MSTLIAISGLGVLCLVLEILNLRKILLPVVLVGLTALLGLNLAEIIGGENIFELESYGMIRESIFSQSFSALFILLAGLVILMTPNFYEDRKSKITDFVSLKVFMLAGAVAMVSFGNFIIFFIGLEILSISVYILAAGKPEKVTSNEAGMKYFLMGAVASSFVLFGLALIYGATASFEMGVVAEKLATGDLISSSWMTLGLIMLFIGMLFKASVFPFHFWAPDVYHGSPTVTTAIMSTLVKVAAIGSFFYIASGLSLAITEEVSMVIVILSILTMTVANITALKQINIKRMMAYSGISHAGFMIMLLTVAPVGANTVLYYCAAYSLAGIAAFGVIMAVCKNKDNQNIRHFNGLFSRRPFLAVMMACALMSLGGIPVFAGFFAKFFLFREMLDAGQLVLVIAGVVNSIIAIYYYFGVINVMFVSEKEEDVEIKIPLAFRTAITIAVILNLLLGVFPSIIMGLELL